MLRHSLLSQILFSSIAVLLIASVTTAPPPAHSTSDYNLNDLGTTFYRISKTGDVEEETWSNILAVIPKINNAEDRNEMIAMVLRTLKGDKSSQLLTRMMKSEWEPDTDAFKLALTHRNLYALRLFLDKRCSFDREHQHLLKNIFNEATHKPKSEVWNIIDLIINKQAKIPGAEKVALEFLLRDKTIDETSKLNFLQNSIFSTISIQDKSFETMKLALKQKKFKWVEAMQNNGWRYFFTENDLKRIRDSKNSKL